MRDAGPNEDNKLNAFVKSPIQDKIPIREAHIENFLSLKSIKVRLGRLNVLVGPNGGGKSNFLFVFRFLGEVARTDLTPALQSLFGGYDQVRYRGVADSNSPVTIRLSGEITEHSSPNALDEYTLKFRRVGLGHRTSVLRREQVILLKRTSGRGRRITLSGRKYDFQTLPAINRPGQPKQSEERSGHIQPETSALSVLRRIGEVNDTNQINQLAEIFEDLLLFDPDTALARRPSLIGRDPNLHLSANASNLASVLLLMRDESPQILDAIERDMQAVLPGFQKLAFSAVGGADEAVRVEIVEAGLKEPTPMARASFGTVRAIALFTMLRDPNPPKLICLEEVDHGLHPHALDILVDRLREAANRSQIIVASHSPALVNRLEPNELVIFERDRDDSATRIVQLDVEELKEMEATSGYRLGELWFAGTLGGGLH